MNEKSIRDRLVEHGQTLFRAPKQLIKFTREPQADALLNDLTNHPHAFFLACVMDRQVKAARAWLIPYRISEKIGEFSMKVLSALSRADVNRLMREPEPLHRFVDTMADHFHSAVQRIKNNYAGDASNIWTGKPSSATVVYRFLEFDGVGPKIGSMAANILAREFKIPFADYYSIDISADVHVPSSLLPTWSMCLRRYRRTGDIQGTGTLSRFPRNDGLAMLGDREKLV